VEIGIDSFVAVVSDSLTGANLSHEDRVAHLRAQIQLAVELLGAKVAPRVRGGIQRAKRGSGQLR
jgi:hypothetical protein